MTASGSQNSERTRGLTAEWLAHYRSTWLLAATSGATSTASLSINREDSMQKIVPFLWFDGQAEEAMNFYVSIFKNSKVVR